MSRFQFIADEYPEIFALCSEAEKNKRTNVDLSMLKARQALEKMLSLADPDSLEDNLFDQINSLSGECSPSEMENMHTLRRLSNKAVHGESVYEEQVDEALKALLLSCCWLYFKVDGKSCPVSLFLPEDRGMVTPYVKKSLKGVLGAQQGLKTNHGTNPLAFDNTFDEAENEEQRPLDKDIFETKEEYEERIQKLPPVHLGFGIIDVKQTDSYTRLAFPRFSLIKNRNIAGADIKAFVGRIEEKTDEDYDGEILVALKVYKENVQYDYSRVILKSGTKELPLTALYWKPFAYETPHDFQNRMEQLPLLPIGVCKPIRQKYDMGKQLLPFQVSGFSFVQDVFRTHELSISADRHQAKQICQERGLWCIYGRVQCKENSCFIEAESISNGKIQKSIYKDNDKIQIVNVNIEDRQSAKEWNHLGNCYYHGQGVEQDYVEAVKWYRKSADQGYAWAQNNLGSCYYMGRGVEQDYVETVKWFRKSADQGNAQAQIALGNCYLIGKVVEQDYKEAVKWYRKAADQGDAWAQNALGNCYKDGLGVEQDYKEAVKWYQKAADRGNEDAKRNLKDLEKSSSGCFITTAVCHTFGKPDDCYELTMFRRFRDNWLSQQPDGNALISEYYAVAPAIVKNIDNSADADRVYQKIWELYLHPCLRYLENRQYEDCKNLYVEMVTRLKKRFN